MVEIESVPESTVADSSVTNTHATVAPVVDASVENNSTSTESSVSAEPTTESSAPAESAPAEYYTFTGGYNLTEAFGEKSGEVTVCFTNKFEVRKKIVELESRTVPVTYQITKLGGEVKTNYWFCYKKVRENYCNILSFHNLACVVSSTESTEMAKEDFVMQDCSITYTNNLNEKRVDVWENNYVKLYNAFYSNGVKYKECVFIYNRDGRLLKEFYALWTNYGLLSRKDDAEIFEEYYPDGKLKKKFFKKNNKIHGLCVSMFDNGNVSRISKYNEGVLDGEINKFNPANTIMTTSIYKDGVIQKFQLRIEQTAEAAPTSSTEESAETPATETPAADDKLPELVSEKTNNEPGSQ